MVVHDPVAGIHPELHASVNHYILSVELGAPIWAARKKVVVAFWGVLLHTGLELGDAGLVTAASTGEHQHPHRLEESQRIERISVGGIFRRLEAHSHMALALRE